MSERNAKDWFQVVDKRRKRLEKDWIKSARKVVEIYESEDKETTFNILYSNTETLLPALYNSTPRPEVARRFTQIGPERALDSAVSNSAERTLEYIADSNDGEYQNFDEAVRGAVLDALVPGQGQVRVRYKVEEKTYQSICFETVPWDRFVWGYARQWKHVPWVAFGLDLQKEDFEREFPEFARTEEAKKIPWDELKARLEEEQEQGDGERREPTLLVWEIYDAHTQQVRFVCEYSEKFVKEEPYPFALTTRFPCPEPLRFVRRTHNLTPRPLYSFYETQALEVDKLTRRLQRVVDALRVRGVFNAQLKEIESLFKANDNDMIPLENAAAFMDRGLEQQIWMLPIEQLVAVARELYNAREQAKAVIYEIMGIADILRGASQASETAKAQEIKNQWGTLRVKRAQKDVQLFCRDLFRIAFEYAANLFTPATFKSVTKLPYLFEGQKRELSMQPQQQGQPPNPLLQHPSWEQIIGAMRNRFERGYRIDIETNSTVDLEATEDKAAIGEFMNAFGQMMGGLTPLVESGAMPFEVAKLMLGEVVRRYRFGRRVEDALDMMQPPQKGEDPKAAEERHKLELTRVQAEASRKVGEMQETVIELSSRIARLEIEKTGLRVEQKTTVHQLKTDYDGKMRLAQDNLRGAQDKLASRDIESQRQGLEAMRKDFEVQQKTMQAAQQQQAGIETKLAGVDQVAGRQQQLEAALGQVQSQLQAIVQALQALQERAAAPRKPRKIIREGGKPVAVEIDGQAFPIERDETGRILSF